MHELRPRNAGASDAGAFLRALLVNSLVIAVLVFVARAFDL
jgi:hypothetical protein